MKHSPSKDTFHLVKGAIMGWCKRDKRECIGEICSMRPQPKESETYEDCPEFVIRGQRSKLNLYYDDFGYDYEKLAKDLEILINKPIN